jgi:hypothetical protein
LKARNTRGFAFKNLCATAAKYCCSSCKQNFLLLKKSRCLKGEHKFESKNFSYWKAMTYFESKKYWEFLPAKIISCQY